tara:strand:+ start:2798 stop:3763 length:966 start_codon:yes stop_codon:yes gene_type:complete
MILLTGGAGFIGSNLLGYLNEKNRKDIIIVDNIGNTIKDANLVGLDYLDYVPKDDLWAWFTDEKIGKIESIIHLGACSNTLESNWDYLLENNLNYTKKLWKLASEHQIPFLYASSAATYGSGSHSFSDDHANLINFKPLNLYGDSKHLFDIWALEQSITPPRWYGLKYFNVYGPKETHKNRMASVVWHFINQLKSGKNLKLFSGSHGYGDGEQKRDFIYVDDAVKVTYYLLENEVTSGIYNIGTGKARTFNSLARAIHKIEGSGEIEYVPFPEDLKSNYQAFTEADIQKIRKSGFKSQLNPIEVGVQKYIKWIRAFGDKFQ